VKELVFDPHLERPPQEAIDASMTLIRIAAMKNWGNDWAINGIGPTDRPRYPIHPETLKELKDAVDIAKSEAEAWEKTATQFCLNEDYYLGLLDTIALMLGDDAFTADDHTMSADPLRAKLPEIVRDRLLRLRELEQWHDHSDHSVPCDPAAGWGTVDPEIND
jgi:hypothetical protein